MDEQRAIQLCVRHRDPVGFEFLVQKYRREEQQRVQRALDALTPDHREILLMKYAQEHRYEEIAGLLVQLIRERVRTYKTDPYKEIKR